MLPTLKRAMKKKIFHSSVSTLTKVPWRKLVSRSIFLKFLGLFKQNTNSRLFFLLFLIARGHPDSMRAMLWQNASSDDVSRVGVVAKKVVKPPHILGPRRICVWVNLLSLINPTFSFPAGTYMFKVNNKNTRTRCKISSK